MASYSINEYQIGIICALPKELKAVRAILDEEHRALESKDEQDCNSYVLGRVGLHKVVAAGLPAGVYGTNAATSAARDMSRTFPFLRFALLVGIGGGIPDLPTRDIRLGDVVVSQPSGQHGGVVQYDLNKDLGGGHFEKIGHVNKPPKTLLTALTNIRAELKNGLISQYLEEINHAKPFLREDRYFYQGVQSDHLYCSKCNPPTWLQSIQQCGDCDNGEIRRPPRPDTSPVIHYGTIASANTLLKNAKQRDQLGTSYGALCVEMEAAGLMDEFPCMVIRGICDYADAYKNDIWQEYAALTAAVFAKTLLGYVTPFTMSGERPTQPAHKTKHRKVRNPDCHRAFRTSNYEAQKNINPDAVTGTCRWVLEHQQFKDWSTKMEPNLLWITADPGCGKSVLSKYLVDVHLPQTNPGHTICYFFFKDNEEQNGLATALCAILHQMFSQQPWLIRHAVPAHENSGDKLQNNTDKLWKILCDSVNDATAKPVVCVLDALDESREADRGQLINLLYRFYTNSCQNSLKRSKAQRWLVTSRPYDDICDGFEHIPPTLPSIRLSGEEESDQIKDEINLVIKEQMEVLSRQLHLAEAETEKVTTKLLSMEHRTYLWLHLAIDEIKNSFRQALWSGDQIIPLIPKSVGDAYEKILQRVKNNTEKQHARLVLTIIIGSRRPLSLEEMAIALNFAAPSESLNAFKDLKVDATRLDSRIRRWCGLFVLITGGKLYLLHQTAKEFLLAHNSSEFSHNSWQHGLHVMNVEKDMARICVLFLCLFMFDESLRGEPKVPKTMISSVQTFCQFAVENWAGYVRSSESQLDNSTLEGIRTLYRNFNSKHPLWFKTMLKAVASWLDQDYRERYQDQCDHDIHLAAWNGHNRALLEILASSQGVNCEDSHGRTALYWASIRGHVRIIQTLLDRGAKTNSQGPNQNTALQVASSNGYLEVVQALLDRGAEINAQSRFYGTALYEASWRGHLQVVQVLLKNGADINVWHDYSNYSTALEAAVHLGYFDIVQTLLDGGADIGAQDGYHNDLLQQAVSEGHLEVVQALLDRGAEINAQVRFYGTALFEASLNGHVQIVQLLLNRGADVNARSSHTCHRGTALQIASYKGHLQVVQALLNKGASVNDRQDFYFRDFDYDSNICSNALQAASAMGHIGVVQALLNAGAEVEAQSGEQGTPLQMASYTDHLGVVQALLDKGARANDRRLLRVYKMSCRNDAMLYDSALSAASANGHYEIVQILLDHRAIDTRPKTNATLSRKRVHEEL